MVKDVNTGKDENLQSLIPSMMGDEQSWRWKGQGQWRGRDWINFSEYRKTVAGTEFEEGDSCVALPINC